MLEICLATIGVCVFRALTLVGALFIFGGMILEIFRVSFIGHREIHKATDVFKKLDEVVAQLIRGKEYVDFYVGRNGDFDTFSASAVKRAQKQIRKDNNSLVLVLPYASKDQQYYEKYYDDICMPISSNTHYKSAITKRNQWMVDNSDLVIAYVEKQSGGAYAALKYAQKRGIAVRNIALEKDDM